MNSFFDYIEIIPCESDMYNELGFRPSMVDFEDEDSYFLDKNYAGVDIFKLEQQADISRFLFFYEKRIRGIINMIFDTETNDGTYHASKEAKALIGINDNVNYISINFANHEPITISDSELLKKILPKIEEVISDTLERYPLTDIQSKSGLRSSYFSDLRDEIKPFKEYLSAIGHKNVLKIIYELFFSNFQPIFQWLDNNEDFGVANKEEKYGKIASTQIAFDNFISKQKIKENVKKSQIKKLKIY